MSNKQQALIKKNSDRTNHIQRSRWKQLPREPDIRINNCKLNYIFILRFRNFY